MSFLGWWLLGLLMKNMSFFQKSPGKNHKLSRWKNNRRKLNSTNDNWSQGKKNSLTFPLNPGWVIGILIIVYLESPYTWVFDFHPLSTTPPRQQPAFSSGRSTGVSQRIFSFSFFRIIAPEVANLPNVLLALLWRLWSHHLETQVTLGWRLGMTPWAKVTLQSLAQKWVAIYIYIYPIGYIYIYTHLEPKEPLFWMEKALLCGVDLQK